MDSSASLTARMVAVGRALHIFHHGPRALVTDSLAWPLIGPEAETLSKALRGAIPAGTEIPTATWLAARARITEDWLAESGAEQYVVLGAGLDTYAWRQRDGRRVFEVDHPVTQSWKRTRLDDLGVPIPGDLVWVPVDFEHEPFGPCLARMGHDGSRLTFTSWLGVIPYLSREAIDETLSAVPRGHLALSYIPPQTSWDFEAQSLGQVIASLADQSGEPWVSLLDPDDLAGILAAHGLRVIDDVGAPDIGARFGLPALNYERLALATHE